MERNAEELIVSLMPEIDRKCTEIRNARAEKRRAKLFVLLCAAVILIPTLFVFCGFSLTVLIIPAAVAAVDLFVLSPILIHQQGGCVYEQA